MPESYAMPNWIRPPDIAEEYYASFTLDRGSLSFAYGPYPARVRLYSGTAIRFFFPDAGSRSSVHTRPPAV